MCSLAVGLEKRACALTSVHCCGHCSGTPHGRLMCVCVRVCVCVCVCAFQLQEQGTYLRVSVVGGGYVPSRGVYTHATQHLHITVYVRM